MNLQATCQNNKVPKPYTANPIISSTSYVQYLVNVKCSALNLLEWNLCLCCFKETQIASIFRKIANKKWTLRILKFILFISPPPLFRICELRSEVKAKYKYEAKKGRVRYICLSRMPLRQYWGNINSYISHSSQLSFIYRIHKMVKTSQIIWDIAC